MNEPERFQTDAYRDVLSSLPATGRLMLGRQALTTMTEAACAGYPLEVCGLLIGDRPEPDVWRVTEARAVENLNRERAADRFLLDPKAFLRIDRELAGTDREIVGVYHSHPDCPARPSPTDRENAWEDFVYPILSVENGRMSDIRAWCLDAEGRFREVRIETE